MKAATTRDPQYTQLPKALYLALELSSRTWKLGMTVGFGQKARERNVSAGDLRGLREEIFRAKKRFGLNRSAPVYCCYEAGRDGFWIHRALVAMGIDNVIVDPSSIEVPRRKRRAKTDRLDVHKLLKLLIRYRLGEEKVWSVVRVPSVEDEDNRHLHRELMALKRERTQHVNRIKGLLTAVGVCLRPRRRALPEQLKQVRLWDASPLPAALHCRILREHERLQCLQRQIVELEGDRAECLRECGSPAVAKARKMNTLRGVGANGAWLLAMEFFSWRELRNRRQVGSLSGLTGTPTTAATRCESRVSARPAIGMSGRWPSRWRGPGSASSHAASLVSGISNASEVEGNGCDGSASSLWRASFWSLSGAGASRTSCPRELNCAPPFKVSEVVDNELVGHAVESPGFLEKPSASREAVPGSSARRLVEGKA